MILLTDANMKGVANFKRSKKNGCGDREAVKKKKGGGKGNRRRIERSS